MAAGFVALRHSASWEGWVPIGEPNSTHGCQEAERMGKAPIPPRHTSRDLMSLL